MENTVFYGGIAYGTTANMRRPGTRADEKKLYQQGLPIFRLKRGLSYLVVDGTKRRVEHLQVCYALLPQYARKRFTGRGYGCWRKKDRSVILQKTIERAEREFHCQEKILTWKEDLGELPRQLYAAYLYSMRPLERICLTLPEDCGGYVTDSVTELLLPYLPRLRELSYYGKENSAVEELGDFFYQEYGMLMQTIKTVPTDRVWMNWNTVSEDALKFLDTRVKNGYNTEVNWGLLQTITKT